MISLDLSNLAKIKSAHGLSSKELACPTAQIKKYLKKILSRKQGFYKIIDDREVIKKINAFVKARSGKYREIVVLGIGGSALGTICLQQSLMHLFINELSRKSKTPRLHVLDNIDPALMADFEDLIDLKHTLFIVVTKSGTTPETLAQYFYYASEIQKQKLRLGNHFIFITGPKKGLLRQIALSEKIPCFDIPENVGGRFSVLTAVGLLPAKFIGLNIEKLLEGARTMRDSFFKTDFGQNPAFRLALTQYLLSKKGKNINVLMPYSQKLIRLADWYRQLLAESIGKEGHGLTPVNALGVTDQHSQNQLYNEGPNDKLLIFIKVGSLGPGISIPHMSSFPGFNFPGKLTFNQLMQTEMVGTISSLTKNNRPNITINIPKVDEFHLGQLLMLLQSATAFLGELFNINAYDQPGVEMAKKITRELLAKKP